MRRPVLVDANLLLLLAVGLQNPRSIIGFKRVTSFSHDDFEVLRDFLASSSSLITTAHVLTEVSNLAGSASGRLRDQVFRQIALLAQAFEEQPLPARKLCQMAEFQRFELTDAALTQLSARFILLTEDVRLASYLKSKSLQAMTLEEIKSLRKPLRGR